MSVTFSHEGYVEHRGHRVWFGIAGNDRGRPPLLTVHGGPGICHDCLEPLAALGDERQVVFYDQYGCGLSDRADDPNEYDIALFVDELATVRRELGLRNCHLFAHSYGGPLALEYLFRLPALDVRSLVLSNSFPSVAALDTGWSERLAALGSNDAAVLRAAADVDPDVYGAALGRFVERFVHPMPLPEPVVRSQEHSGAEVYARMHGSSWFEPDGEWSDWDAASRLPTLRLPALVIGGTTDQCTPELAEQLHAGLPSSELVILDAGHLPFFERRDEYLQLVRSFLRRADS